MAKITLGHPHGTGTPLYGSQRLHKSFVTLTIRLDNGGDHLYSHGDDGDDTGFKGAHDSTIKRIEGVYDKSRCSFSRNDTQDPETGEWKIGEFMGNHFVDAPELEGQLGQVIEVSMSFEQFAEMLVSTGHQIDCTIQSVRNIGKPGCRYGEEVTPPPPIYDRAQRRMEKAQGSALAEIDKGLAEINSWKATKKVKDAATHRFQQARQAIIDNSGFVMQQAGEEMSSMAEGAVSIIMDKVAGLEAEGRLPKGSLKQFRSGGIAALLPGSVPDNDTTKSA